MSSLPNRFLLPLNEEQRVLYVAKLLEMAHAHALAPTFTFANGTSSDPTKDDIAQLDNAVLQFAFARGASPSDKAT